MKKKDDWPIAMMTTTPGFEGYRITGYYGLVFQYAVPPSKFTGDISGLFQDGQDQMCRDLTERLPEGANAVVGIRLEHGTFYAGANRFSIILTGTAVHIEPIQ